LRILDIQLAFVNWNFIPTPHFLNCLGIAEYSIFFYYVSGTQANYTGLAVEYVESSFANQRWPWSKYIHLTFTLQGYDFQCSQVSDIQDVIGH
jgi:hypothetical protein